MTDSADRDGERLMTVGKALNERGFNLDLIREITAIIGLDPSTPLANVVALQPGQWVCEESRFNPGVWRPVAVTTPVQPGSEVEG